MAGKGQDIAAVIKNRLKTSGVISHSLTSVPLLKWEMGLLEYMDYLELATLNFLNLKVG